jgi:hypothetical protein
MKYQRKSTINNLIDRVGGKAVNTGHRSERVRVKRRKRFERGPHESADQGGLRHPLCLRQPVQPVVEVLVEQDL